MNKYKLGKKESNGLYRVIALMIGSGVLGYLIGSQDLINILINK